MVLGLNVFSFGLLDPRGIASRDEGATTVTAKVRVPSEQALRRDAGDERDVTAREQEIMCWAMRPFM